MERPMTPPRSTPLGLLWDSKSSSKTSECCACCFCYGVVGVRLLLLFRADRDDSCIYHVAMDDVASPSPPSSFPVREASQRKRKRTNIGSDFVSDYYHASSRAPSDSPAREATSLRRALRINAQQEKTNVSKVEVDPKISDVDDEHTSNELNEEEELTDTLCFECKSVLGNFSMDANATGERRLVQCSVETCTYEAHAECAKIFDEPEATFRCPDCKRCVLCGLARVRKDNRLIQCGDCSKVYHMACHLPPVDSDTVELWGKKMCCCPGWKCSPCRVAIKGKSKTSPRKSRAKVPRPRSTELEEVSPSIVNGRLDLETDRAKDSQNGDDCNGSHINEIPANKRNSDDGRMSHLEGQRDSRYRRFDALLDDISQEDRELRQDLATWSVEQCAAYFIDSQPELSELILAHDLFGSSLVLISRAQFLHLFGLNIGKSLKLFGAICRWRKITF